jgi:hypothetical protein
VGSLGFAASCFGLAVPAKLGRCQSGRQAAGSTRTITASWITDRASADAIADSELEGAEVVDVSRRSAVETLLVFGPWRSVILLVAGDKSGRWNKWYRMAKQLYEDYLAERKETER